MNGRGALTYKEAERNSAENETRHYWRLVQEIKIVRECPSADQTLLNDLIDELEVLRDYTGSQLLRQRCCALLVEVAPERQAL